MTKKSSCLVLPYNLQSVSQSPGHMNASVLCLSVSHQGNREHLSISEDKAYINCTAISRLYYIAANAVCVKFWKVYPHLCPLYRHRRVSPAEVANVLSVCTAPLRGCVFVCVGAIDRKEIKNKIGQRWAPPSVKHAEDRKALSGTKIEHRLI